jgi:hypothetical protein
MATRTAATSESRLPDDPVGYVAILAAIVTGVLHLVLATQVIGFSQFLAVLFALNGLGFLGGIGVYLSGYWRRELYVVAAGYALVTVLALFVFQGFSVEAFYRGGSVNPGAVISKAAEVVLAAASLYLYATE